MSRFGWAPFRGGMLALALVVAGCSSGPTHLELEGAVYVNEQVPGFAHASLESSMGGTSYGDDGSEVAKSQSWFFHTDAAAEDVVAFYDQALRHAARTNEGGETRYEWLPVGGDAGESLAVIVRDGEIQITESVRPEKLQR